MVPLLVLGIWIQCLLFAWPRKQGGPQGGRCAGWAGAGPRAAARHSSVVGVFLFIYFFFPPPASLMPEQGPRMNGFSLGELCWLFCCPPCPSRIAAKLAFLPPEPTYTVLQPEQQQEAGAAAGAGTPTGSGTCSLHLSERADWQYSQRELDAVEVFFSRTARDNRLGCMFVRCAPTGRYTLLFSHGNAVDLGQMCSFYIGLGSRINCNVFSYDYSGYGVSTGKPSEKNLYADIDAAWQALRTR